MTDIQFQPQILNIGETLKSATQYLQVNFNNLTTANNKLPLKKLIKKIIGLK